MPSVFSSKGPGGDGLGIVGGHRDDDVLGALGRWVGLGGLRLQAGERRTQTAAEERMARIFQGRMGVCMTWAPVCGPIVRREVSRFPTLLLQP